MLLKICLKCLKYTYVNYNTNEVCSICNASYKYYDNHENLKIIHADMDAFFAAIEVRDNPELKGKPVVIGADPRLSGGRGVVSTCNYEARAFGIHSAMSSKEAFERCPQAIFISGHYEKYQEVGRQVREIFHRYTDLVEPMSIDEAYLDVTENKLGLSSAVKIAKLIQYRIAKLIEQDLRLHACLVEREI